MPPHKNVGLSADATDFKPPFLAGFSGICYCSIPITRCIFCPGLDKENSYSMKK